MADCRCWRPSSEKLAAADYFDGAFHQETTIKIDGKEYTLDAEYYYDGERFAAHAKFASCEFDWTLADTGDDTIWKICDVIDGYKYDVQMRASTSFGKFN